MIEKGIDKPVVPISAEADVRKRTDQWSWTTTIFGSGGAGLAARQTVVAIGVLALGSFIIALLLRRQVVCAVRDVRRMIKK